MDKIDRFIGIPFEHNGRNFKSIDCIGLVKLYLNENGIDFYAQDGKQIAKEWYIEDPKRLIRAIKNQAYIINYKDRKKYDIGLFEFSDIVTHIGVMVDRNNFLHIFENRKSGLSRIDKWKNRLVNLYRVGDK